MVGAMTAVLLDAAIATVKSATSDIPRDIEPADLSALVAAARELGRVLDQFVKTLAAPYEHLDGPLGHDQRGDPAATVETVRLRLDDITMRLVDVDEAFADAHNHAARIAHA